MTEHIPTADDRLHLVKLAAGQHAKAREALDTAEATRDEMICQAYAAGIDVKVIADHAGLHYKRIYQIRDAGRSGSAPTD